MEKSPGGIRQGDFFVKPGVLQLLTIRFVDANVLAALQSYLDALEKLFSQLAGTAPPCYNGFNKNRDDTKKELILCRIP